MPLSFRLGRYIDPSGFPIALVNIPPINPEDNISLVDRAYAWEENISSADSPVIQSYVGMNGLMPGVTFTNFSISNVISDTSNDIQVSPLYYRYSTRFYHYSYGNNPINSIYITDQNENILTGLNYTIRVKWIKKFVYQIDILSDFSTDANTIYKVKYNRCDSDGSNIYPSWVEIMNSSYLFGVGNPLDNIYGYSLSGPDVNSLYYPIVPVIPNFSNISNIIGVSFNNAPTIIENNISNTVEYILGVTVTITLIATGLNTFIIQRDYTRNGSLANDYLTSTTADTWGANPIIITTGTSITGIPGITLLVAADNNLAVGDRAILRLSRPYYYLKLAYESIYLSKPRNATTDEDWYLHVFSGRFRRNMDTSGQVVPSGQGTMWEYAVPEYYNSVFSTYYGIPYRDVTRERPMLVDSQTIQLRNTPLFIAPSSVLNNPNDPGFPPTGYITIDVNSSTIDQENILDWNSRGGTVKLGQILSHKDDILVNYTYEDNTYTYAGFVGSGGIYPLAEPLPFVELNLNPSFNPGDGICASGLVASVYLKPYLNINSGAIANANCLYHTFSGGSNPNLGQTDFLLGTVSVGANSKLEDIEITDVRTRGGGLNDDGINNLDKIKLIQPESQFFWDIGYFDGQAVPAEGVLVVRLPKTILAENGGPFSIDEVRKRCYKHIALGEYAIIDFV